MTFPERLEGAVLQEITTTITPEMNSDRKERISRIRSTGRRIAYTAVHRAIESDPDFFAAALDTDTITPNLPYVGMGGECTVFCDKDNLALKLIHRSTPLNEKGKTELIEKQKQDYKLLNDYLGDFMLLQDWAIEPHLMLHGREAVTIRQPYKSIYRPKLFFQTPNKTIGRLRAIESKIPGAIEQLNNFAYGSLNMYDNHGVLPDVHSPGNIGFDEDNGRLLLIDTQPQGRQWPERQNRIQNHLRGLLTAISEYR